MHKKFLSLIVIEMYQILIKIFVFVYDFEITRRVATLTFCTTVNEVASPRVVQSFV